MDALGLIEVIGFPSAIEAADSALKAADIKLGGISKIGSGIVTVEFFGDVGAISAAVDAGGTAAARIGTVRATHIIPRVDSSVLDRIIKKPSEATEEMLPYPEGATAKQTNQADHISTHAEEYFDDTKEFSDSNITDMTGISENSETEDLQSKSNAELKSMINDMGIQVDEKELKYAKKEVLISIIQNHLRKEGEG